jgi:hypothetical protein
VTRINQQSVSVMALLVVLAAFATAAPVWIASNEVDGLMVSWKSPQVAQMHVFITTVAGTKTYPLDRMAGTMIIPHPSQPYRIGYQIEAGPPITLTESGRLPSRTSEVPVINRPTAPMAQVRMRFSSGFERAALLTPLPPEHLKRTVRRRTKTVELFIKVNPSGKVMGTSSPYYRDSIRRDLAHAASEVAIKRWRFQQYTGATYRDARLQVSFSRWGTRIRALPA